MNFQKAFENIFNFSDSAEAIVFAAILFVTFLLGLLIWALLAHLPQRRKLKKDIKLLRGELDNLSENYKELEDKHTVQTAKVQRLEEEATKRTLELEEQMTKLNQIQDLYIHLEAERDQKVREAQAAEDERNELQKLYKYAQQEIVESGNKEAEAIKKSEKALEKVENMKILMEEIEQDRQKAVDEMKAMQEALAKANLANEELHKDLGAALNQLAAYEAKDLDGLAMENESLKKEIATLQESLQQLDAEKKELAQNLATYTSKESEVLQEEIAEEQLMDDLLAAAESALSEKGFYQDIGEDELIEDRTLLETKLAELEESSRGMELDFGVEDTPELDEEEDELMSRALEEATEAMNMQGFFQDIEEAVLLSTDGDDVEDEELMNQALGETADLMENSPFFKELGEDELVEDPELLLAQLQQEPESTARGLGKETETELVEWDDEEEELMSRALESANLAMNTEGLYATIDPAKLIEPKDEILKDESKEPILDPKYKTALEQYIVAELGKSIPKASEMNKDDLKKINGIGAFIEEKLNYLGFYTYEQIASLQDESYRAKLMAVLGLSADAIDRDQWLTQAQALMTKQKINDLTKDININKLFKK